MIRAARCQIHPFNETLEGPHWGSIGATIVPSKKALFGPYFLGGGTTYP